VWITFLLSALVKRRRFVIVNTLIVTVLAAVISLVLPKTFRAKATILPPESQSPLSGLMGLSTNQIAMAVTNFSLPLMATPSDLYASMLESETILKRVVDSLDLKTEYRERTEWSAVAALKQHLRIKVEPDGIITIEADARSAEQAAKMANLLVAYLDEFNRQIQNQKGKDYSEFLAVRLQSTSDELTKAQNELKAFQETHRAIALDIQSEALINNLAQQKALLTSDEIELEMLKKTLYPSHPEVVRKQLAVNEVRLKLREIEEGSVNRADSTLSALDIPLSAVPELTLQFAILKRNAKIQEAIYEMLSQQLEMARIQQHRDTPTVVVMDRAHPPESAVKPQKRVIVMAAFFLSFCATAMLALYSERMREGAGSSPVVQQLSALFNELKRKPLG
jgi:tyrosine-protein kinase Etk/Wzc